MATNTRLEIDPRRLEEFRERLRGRALHPRRRFATAFLRQGLVFFLLLFLVLPLVMGTSPFGEAFTGRKVLILGAAAVVAATFSGLLAYRGARDTLSLGLNEHQRILAADWKRWAGRGWLRRTLTMGAGITGGVGLPVGLLIALTSPVADLPSGSRVLMGLSFIGLTALWAFPMAVGIRWYVVRDYRGMAPAPVDN